MIEPFAELRKKQYKIDFYVPKAASNFITWINYIRQSIHPFTTTSRVITIRAKEVYLFSAEVATLKELEFFETKFKRNSDRTYVPVRDLFLKENANSLSGMYCIDSYLMLDHDTFQL